MPDNPAAVGPIAVTVQADGSFCPTDLVGQRYGRLHPEAASFALVPARTNQSSACDTRTPTERDRDRILYSKYMTRLSGVTQIVSPESVTSQFHSRLTHTYKVANIARAIATDLVRTAAEDDLLRDKLLNLGGIDIAACEAAGLAHDIGHPPFGHAAEVVLDKWLRKRGVDDGFEGNAQSIRTVLSVDHRNQLVDGLELTAVTVAAIAKYPWTRDYTREDRSSKFNFYESEAAALEVCRQWFPGPTGTQTLEASVMDIADDITYAVHDLEDFIASGLVSPGAVARDLRTIHQGVAKGLDRGEQIVPGTSAHLHLASARKVAKYYPGFFDLESYRLALAQAASWFEQLALQDSDVVASGELRYQMSGIIGRYIDAIECVNVASWPGGPHLHLDQSTWHHLQVLKAVARAHIVDTAVIGLHQRAQEVSMTKLMRSLRTWLKSVGEKQTALPPSFAHLLTGAGLSSIERARAIADFVCTLSDSECQAMSVWLEGQALPRIVP